MLSAAKITIPTAADAAHLPRDTARSGTMEPL